jgi:hypothetical protein
MQSSKKQRNSLQNKNEIVSKVFLNKIAGKTIRIDFQPMISYRLTAFPANNQFKKQTHQDKQ